ncbi:MAG: NUDIX hydrolase, partial [Woeseiaceae bacterium]
AFADRADLLEELKSDLVSLFAAPALRASGYHDDVGLRAQYADGIRRTLQTVQPRPEQPYQNMQLMQFNYFIEMGLLEVDAESALLTVNYERYHEVVGQMLEQVLQIHYSGDYELADEFVTRWNYWDDKLHGRLATLIQESGIYRRTLVRYHALGD